MTLEEIAERLAIPKTTVWYWIKDIEVEIARRSSSGADSAARTAARRRAGEANSKRAGVKRQAAYEEGRSEYPQLILEPTFRDFICLYIGEGTKRMRSTVALANSDKQVIQVADLWMQRLSNRPVAYVVQHHQDQEADVLRDFWSRAVRVDPSEIRLFPKTNSGQLRARTWRSEHGVMTVRTHDTFLRCKVQAWMDEVQREWLEFA